MQSLPEPSRHASASLGLTAAAPGPTYTSGKGVTVATVASSPGTFSSLSTVELGSSGGLEVGRAAAGPASPAGLVNTQQVARENCLTLENTADSRAHRRAQRCSHRTITRARLMDESVHRGGFRGRWLMVTLTYRPEVKWDRRQAAEFWHRVRQWYGRQGVPLRYVWTMELTGKGKPHYHALLWVPRHLMLPTPDKRGWWGHGMTRTEVARNAVGYLAKYASKGVGVCDAEGELYRFPRNARIGGGTVLKGEAGQEWRYWTAPRWAREQVEAGADLRRVPGGFVATATGEYLANPWRFVGLSADGKQLLFVIRSGAVPAAPDQDRPSGGLTTVGGSQWKSSATPSSPSISAPASPSVTGRGC